VSTLELCHIAKSFETTRVIQDVSLKAQDGEFLVLVGPSGCGKSTLLRMIAGLETPTSGDIEIDGQRVNSISAADRGCAMVFQSYALYPHMSVYDNMAFGLENAGIDKQTIKQQVSQAATLLRLDGLLMRRPTQLSGGQRQRVAIGRAIVRKPKIFLFDEPLSNLDAELRVSMRSELRDLHQRLRATMVYVTHDQVEAMTLADRIVVLRNGHIEQIGTPQELYEKPCNVFVAGFIGSPRMNFISSELLNALPKCAKHIATGSHQIGIRPEHWQLALNGEGLELLVHTTEYMGAHSLVQGTLKNGAPLEALLSVTVLPKQGESIHLQVPVEKFHCFSSEGQRLENAA
jgi:ABC-type sugar transport system ATPase subunit